MFAERNGLTHVDHFEQVALFGESIGADRISDIVCNVLKSQSVEYTQRVAAGKGVPMTDVKVRSV